MQELDAPEQRGGPRWWVRLVLYGFTWLPAFVVIVVHAPRFAPIFAKLQARGELPALTSWFMVFVRFNASCLSLPTLLIVLALLTVDELAVSVLRRQRRGKLWSWLWVTGFALAGIGAQMLVAYALVLPVFEMDSVIR
ncbi:MAG: hypothetical protein HYS12_13845 [Planctomycetes bacterium]|nr:hypothetical protein [Planctomycetota bacterium]